MSFFFCVMTTLHVKYLFVVLVLFLFSEAAILGNGLNTPDPAPARRYASPIGPTQTATATFPREDLAERSNEAGEAKPTSRRQVASLRNHTPRQAFPSLKYSPPPKHDDPLPFPEDPDDISSQDNPSWDDGEDDSPDDKKVRRQASPLRQHTPRRAVPTGQHYPHRVERSRPQVFPSPKFSPPPKHDDPPPFSEDPDGDSSQDDPSGDDGEDDSPDDTKVRREATPLRHHIPRQAVPTGQHQPRRAEHFPHQAFPSQKYSPPSKHDDPPPFWDSDDIPSQDDPSGDHGDDGDDGDDGSPEDISPDSPAKHRRSIKQQVTIGIGAGFCPAGLFACPIQSALGLFPGAVNDEYECVDFKSDLDNCGGCSSLDPGRYNCRAIPHVSSVACVSGQCVVTACQPGYTPKADTQICASA